MTDPPRMHADEVETDSELVRRLVATRFPDWADRPVEPIVPRGTDNASYRLGEDMLVRLPRRAVNVAALATEVEWLPVLAPELPLPVPVPLAMGEPDAGFPFPWAVLTWLEGATAIVETLRDPRQTAADLAAFVLALRAVDASSAPPALRHGPLQRLDDATRAAVAKLAGGYDSRALLSIWDEALEAAPSDGPPTWCHADLDLRNLLFADGRLCGVLDFGGVGAGDPACDAAAAWKVLPVAGRDVFLSAIGADDATIARARGWVVSEASLALSYYTAENNAPLCLEARRWLREIVSG